MNKTAIQFIKDLPPWSKGLLAVGALGVVVALGLTVRNYIKKKNDSKDSSDAVNEAQNEIKNLAAKGINPTYQPSQYKIWANAAEECFQGYGTCTGDTIFMNMKNDADVLALIKAFGVRTISSGRFNPEPDTVGDLSKIIRSELSISDINAINKILALKGITYKF